MANTIPAGFHTLTPYLHIRDAAKAIEFYKRAFGAEERDRALSPDGKIMATGCFGGGYVKLWDPVTLRMLASIDRIGGPTALAFSGDGKRLAIGNSDGQARVWDTESIRETHKLSGHTQGVYALSFSRRIGSSKCSLVFVGSNSILPPFRYFLLT